MEPIRDGVVNATPVAATVLWNRSKDSVKLTALANLGFSVISLVADLGGV